MGKIRVVPKLKQPPAAEVEYFKEILREAESQSLKNHVFYDLDPDEPLRLTRARILKIAETEGYNLDIRIKHKPRTLQLIFSTRITRQKSSKGAILDYLSQVEHPASRGEIVDALGLSLSTWTLYITDLVNNKQVIRIGSRRNSTYSLVT